MIHNLKPYPKYKDSGVPWLGKVPEHWGIRRLKQVCRFAYGDSLPTEIRQQGEIAVFGSNGRVGFHSTANTHTPCIVIGRKGSFGKVNFSTDSVFAIDTTFFIDDRFTKANLHWLYYLLGWLRLDEVSKDSAVPGLHREDAYQRIVAYPTDSDEQSAIVHYIDYIDRQIRRYIRAKQKLIKLLEEQKQAIIHQAVTCGLDPDVRLKPSGVEWLGDVPEHWEVIPLKSLSSVQSGITLGKQYIGQKLVKFPYLRVANVQEGYVNLSEIKTIEVPVEEASRSLLQKGDVLMTEGGDPDKLGRGCAWEGQISPCLHQNHIFAVRPNINRLRPYYLAILLSSQYSKEYFLRTAKQTTNLASTNKTTIGQFPIPLPKVEEQDLILDKLENELAGIGRVVSGISHEISLLREYRTRLIADVVTGKLDVREATKNLPEESEEMRVEEDFKEETTEEELEEVIIEDND